MYRSTVPLSPFSRAEPPTPFYSVRVGLFLGVSIIMSISIWSEK